MTDFGKKRQPGICMLPQNAKHWDIRGKMDITLFYREKGNGEPFVLLHGNGEDSSYFKHQIEYFCDRYRVIRAGYERTWKISPGDKSLYDQAVFVRFI